MSFNAEQQLCAICIESNWLVAGCDRCTEIVNAIHTQLYAIKNTPYIYYGEFYTQVDASFTAQQLLTVMVNKYPIMSVDAIDWIHNMNKSQLINAIWLFCLQNVVPSPAAVEIPVVPDDVPEFAEDVIYIMDRVGDPNQRHVPNPRRQEIHQNFMLQHLMPQNLMSVFDEYINEYDDDRIVNNFFLAEQEQQQQQVQIENKTFDIKVTMFRSKKDDSKTFYCCACLEDDIDKKTKVAYSDCSHSNCLDCFKGMLTATKRTATPSCPECRANIKHVKVANKAGKEQLAELCCPIIKKNKPRAAVVTP